MDLMRRYFRDRTFAWGASEFERPQAIEGGLEAYTALVEEMLAAALQVAQAEKKNGTLEWSVIGLGRLGTLEMDYGSDADLVFVAAHVEAEERGREVAEKFLHVLSAYTREGSILVVDPRLRARGSEGELVQTADSVLDYFTSVAEPWEAATYLKARPVAGDRAYGMAFCERLRQQLGQRFRQWPSLRPALRDMRQRLETEATSAQARDNFKTGAGGFYDLDFLLAVLALEAGGLSLADRGLEASLQELGGGGLGEEEQVRLSESAHLLRTVDHAIRLVTGRATAQVPAGRQGEAVAELAGRWLGESLSPALLAVRVGQSRDRIRQSFLGFFGG
jgi:glutamate-ammonia-ligase adenylyltransferase